MGINDDEIMLTEAEKRLEELKREEKAKQEEEWALANLTFRQRMEKDKERYLQSLSIQEEAMFWVIDQYLPQFKGQEKELFFEYWEDYLNEKTKSIYFFFKDKYNVKIEYIKKDESI